MRRSLLVFGFERNAAEGEQKDEQPNGNAVPSEGTEAVARDIVDEVFHRHEAYAKATTLPKSKTVRLLPRSEHFGAAVLDQIVDLLERGAEHGGHGQEEGEFGGVLAAEALLHAATMVAMEREVPGSSAAMH